MGSAGGNSKIGSMCVVLALASLLSAVAHAEESPQAENLFRFTDRPLMVSLVVGFATPTGEIGVTAEYNLTSWFAAGIGVGTNVIGMQLAASGRLRLAR